MSIAATILVPNGQPPQTAAITESHLSPSYAAAAASQSSPPPIRSHIATTIAPSSPLLAPTPASQESNTPIQPRPAVVVATTAQPSLPARELHLGGIRSRPAPDLLKVRGYFDKQETTFMIDSGASSEFIDTEFAQRCGLTLTPSDSTIRLADGTVVPASGQTTIDFTLAAKQGESLIPCTATFTVTPLKGYDAILGYLGSPPTM